MNNQTNTRRIQAIVGLIIAFALGFYAAQKIPLASMSGPTIGQTGTATPPQKIAIPNIDDVWATLNKSFIDPAKLNLSEMQADALKGFVRGANDPYTLYMTPEESKEFDIDLEGELEGIGAVLESKNGIITVVSAVKNSPASKAGLQSGDIVYKIDGVTTEKTSLSEAVKKIRGKKGTSVIVTILRAGAENPMDITLIRDEIHIDSVTMEEKNGIYHVSINQFNQSTKKEFDTVVQKALLEKPKGMIIDVRDNGGGFLATSVEIISDFLKKDAVVSKIKTRDPAQDEVLKVENNGRLTDIPVVVLINEGSASASEILAGALHDHKRAILMGEKSFGKGSVQELTKVRGGGLLRVTIAKWYTPNDINIDETGITPDIAVPMTSEDVKNGKDPQLDAAQKYLTE